MSTHRYTIKEILWNKTEKSDKIWGYLTLSSNSKMHYCFWGRRGNSPTWKRYDHEASLETLAREKKRKGYAASSMEEMEGLLPGFTDELEISFTGARICNQFHGE